MTNHLKIYNQKRNFNKTKEPKGIKRKSSKKLRFVIQHHLARKDHYDFRLEWNGVLKSWAIPKGPSYNPKDKRLAVQVEDHPYSYRNFEGTIPKGEYGGGTVMILDEGYWEPMNQPNFIKGPIKFKLKGKRFQGIWTLVPFKDRNWLLIKDSDENVQDFHIEDYVTSIRTKRTMKEIEAGISTPIEITNSDKVIYMHPKITKGDIVEYYQKIAKHMLPYIENRLISTIRCPNGILHDQFFMKHLDSKNKGLGKKILTNKNGEKEEYYYIKTIDGLISEVQMNSYEFHIWGCNANLIHYPNMMVLDLDPDEKISLKKVRDGVKDIKNLLDELGLNAYLKTSGGKGYHIVIPFKQKISWNHFREIAKNIAELMESKWPDKYTSNMRKRNREGKIFIDWVRNTKGATSVAPYSLRLREYAPISMPISWDEIDYIKPNEITIQNIFNILDDPNYIDPWSDYFK